MTKLPDCPSCQEPDLYLLRMGDVFECRCKECGWSTGRVTLATGQDLREVVEATVAKAGQDAQGERG